jgi:Tfp pilus assembly protein PilF
VDMGMPEKAEEQYSLALAADPKNVTTLSSYGNLLLEMGKKEGAEKQYKLALKADPKHIETRCNYGHVLSEMGRLKEAEEQYKIILETNPNNVKVHLNYGFLLKQMGRLEEAETQYKVAIRTDPKYARARSSYGFLLLETGRLEEANEQIKAAIELDPKNPDIHGIYSLLLFSRNLEKEAIGEMKLASSLFRENGDTIKENLVLAWLYEEFANRYYDSKSYRKFVEFAEASGDKYIDAGKQAGDKLKGISLTRGYLLKGKARILKLNFRPPYNIEMFTKILNDIDDVSKFYKNAAGATSENNPICNACSVSMSCLSEMLGYMLAVARQEKVPALKGETENWKKGLASCEKIYIGNEKSEKFLLSLNKLMVRLENLNKSKDFTILQEEKELKEYIRELSEIARNIEGTVEKIMQDSAKQMDIYKLKTIPYIGTGTKLIANSTYIITTANANAELESISPIESRADQKTTGFEPAPETNVLNTPESDKSSGMLKWIYNPQMKISMRSVGAIVVTVVLVLILTGIVLSRFSP